MEFIKTIKNSKVIYFVTASHSLLGLLITALLFKYFGSNEYGLFVLVVTISGFLVDVVSARTNEAVTFYLRRKEDSVSNIITMGVLFDAVVVVLFGVLIAFVLFLLPYYSATSQIDQYSVLYFSIYQGVLIAFGTTQGYYLSKERYDLIVKYHMGSTIVRFISIILFVFEGRSSHLDIAQAYAISSLVYLFPILKVIFLIDLKSKIKKEFSIEFVRYSLKVFLSTFLKSGNKRVDNFLVGIVMGPSLLALYDVFKKISMPVSFFLNPLSSIFLPKFVDSFKGGEANKVRAVVSDAFKFITKVQLIFFMASFLFIYFDPFLMFKEHRLEVTTTFFAFTYLFMAVEQHRWWCRAFSSASDPKLSIYANLFMTILYFCIVYPLSVYFDYLGFLIGMVFINIVISYYWKVKLHDYCKAL
jgi:O-antigen/teichoic acid export membrane protein